MRGPGPLGYPDTTSRLAGELGASGHPSARGLIPQNYYRTTRGRGGRGGRGVRDIPAQWLTLVDYAVARLIHSLRYKNPGINVRLPSHIHPPFRAVQFSFFQVQTAGAVPVTTQVTFNGQSVVPEGVQGVVSTLEVKATSNDQDTTVDPTTVRFGINKNGLAVPGFLTIDGRVGFTQQESVTDIGGAEIRGANFEGPKIVSPIKLAPGDTLTTTIQLSGGATALRTLVFLAGWLYPIEVEADGIVGTLADRGGPMV